MRKQDIIRKTIKDVIKGKFPSSELMQHCLEVSNMRHLVDDFIVRQIYDLAGKGICNNTLPYGTTCNLATFLIRAGGYIPHPTVTPYQFLVTKITVYDMREKRTGYPPFNTFQNISNTY